MAKRWTYEEDQIIRNYFGKKSNNSICKMLPDRTIVAIKSRVRVLEKKEKERQHRISIWDQIFWCNVAGRDEEIPANLKKNFEMVCSMMMEQDSMKHARGISVLNLYYKHALSMEEIGVIYNVSRERIYQILNHYIRHMRHPKYRYVLENGEPKPEHEVPNISDRSSDKDSIDILNLSVRCYNVLKRGGIDTIRELITTTERDLRRFRNMGEKNIAEIKEELGKIGLQLPNK